MAEAGRRTDATLPASGGLRSTSGERESERPVTRKIAVILIVTGMMVGVLGWAVLPQEKGRFSYAIEIVDPRAPGDSRITPGLRALGGVPALIMEQAERRLPERLMLLPDLPRLLKASDCALGSLPDGDREAVAGAAAGVERGEIGLGGVRLRVVGVLEPLGPSFDASLLMRPSPKVEHELKVVGWRPRAHYLLLAHNLADQEKLLAQLRARPELLPTPGAEVRSIAGRRGVPRATELTLAMALVLLGAALLFLQLHGLSREEIARRFGRA